MGTGVSLRPTQGKGKWPSASLPAVLSHQASWLCSLRNHAWSQCEEGAKMEEHPSLFTSETGQDSPSSSSSASGEGQVSRPPPGGHLLLTVGIQEREHLGLRHARSQQPGCNEPFPLRLPQHPDDLQLLDVLLQPLLQVFWKGQGHCYQLLTNPPWAPCPGTPRSSAGLNANPSHTPVQIHYTGCEGREQRHAGRKA